MADDARGTLDVQRCKMYAELDTAAEEYANLDAVIEYAARWGQAMRAVLDVLDSPAPIVGEQYRYHREDVLRKAINDALAGEG